MEATVAAHYIAVCKLKKGQVKRLPMMSLKPMMFVVACPCCNWKSQVMATDRQLGENPLQLEPAVRCDGCGASYAIVDGVFTITGA